MKKLFFILFSFTIFSACNNTESESSKEISINSISKIANTKSTLSCKINGKEFTPTFYVANLNKDQPISVFALIASGGEEVGLHFPADVQPGTYSWDAEGLNRKYSASYTQPEAVIPQTNTTQGSLVITDHDTSNNRVKGTFTFTAKADEEGNKPSVVVTDGKFDVTYKVFD